MLIVKIFVVMHLFLDVLSKLLSWKFQSRFCLGDKLFSKFRISELELLMKHENDEAYDNTSDFTEQKLHVHVSYMFVWL